MKQFSLILIAIVALVVAAPPEKDMDAMVKKVAEFAAGYTGTVDKFKADLKEEISADKGTYTIEEANGFLDAVCKIWTAKIMKCEDFRAYIVETKKSLGKIKN